MRVAVVILVCCGLLALDGASGQGPSPCPDVFAYEPRKSEETDRWTGVITIKSNEELEGVWLNFSVDSPANVLLNWFGESTSKNNRDFQVRDLNYIVKPNQVLRVKFQIVYNEAEKVPSLTRILLNGKIICSGPKRAAANVVTTRSTIPPPLLAHSIEDDPSQGTTKRGPDFFTGELILIDSSIHSKPPDITDNVQCGTKIEKGIGLITEGQPSEEGEWPWHVAIYKSGLQLLYICGGSLVSKDYIVTAAHCVTKPKTKIVINPNTFMIQLGRTFLRKYSPNNQERGLSKITVHPNYDPMYYHNDVAVLKLSKPAELTDFVRPVCLWDEGPNVSIIGRLGSVVGWGYTANHTISDVLQEAMMPVVDTLTCIYSNTNFFNKVTSRTTFCAGFRNGTSVCNGDSGGGMFFPKNTTTGEPVWQLRGLVSVSLVLQKRYCDPFNYVVFTDLAHFADWITDNLV